MKRRRTLDRDPHMPDLPPHTIMTHEQIGPTRHMTAEGFLLCKDVAIARTGWMVYGAQEVPITTNDSGYTLIHRGPETLFSAKTMGSFVGKPVTNDHPREGVNPENWARVAVGSAHNLRRGAGADSEVLLADLLITDAQAIRDIKAGKVEVSAGYDADYQTTAPGEGRQLNIFGNHIALVARGRCGPRCAIGDTALTTTQSKETLMPTVNKGKQRRIISDAVRQQVLDAGIEAMEAIMNEQQAGSDDGDDDNNVHIHLHGATGDDAGDTPPVAGKTKTIDSRMSALETGMATLTTLVTKLVTKDAATGDQTTNENDDTGGEEDDDKKKPKTKAKDKTDDDDSTSTADSAALETSYKATVADAEVLVPGIALPTFDAAKARKATVDSMCAIRRKALDISYATTEGKLTVDAMTGGSSVDLLTMDCAGIATLFKATAGAKRLVNNRAATGDAQRAPNQQQGTPGTPSAPRRPTIAEINEANHKFYATANA